jgi:hypothetical protein
VRYSRRVQPALDRIKLMKCKRSLFNEAQQNFRACRKGEAGFASDCIAASDLPNDALGDMLYRKVGRWG